MLHKSMLYDTWISENRKTGIWCFCALYIILKMNCALKPHNAKYEIIKLTTDEVPQSCWTQWINLNAREGHIINIFKHWKYTIEIYFVKGSITEFYRNRTAVNSKRKFPCKHLSILIAMFSEFCLEESYCGDRKVPS